MTRPDPSHLYDSRMCRNSSIDRLCKHPTAGLFRPATMATRVPVHEPTSLHHSFPTLGPEGGFHSTRKLGATDECQAEALTNAKDGQLWGRFGPCGVARASSPACPLSPKSLHLGSSGTSRYSIDFTVRFVSGAQQLCLKRKMFLVAFENPTCII